MRRVLSSMEEEGFFSFNYKNDILTGAEHWFWFGFEQIVPYDFDDCKNSGQNSTGNLISCNSASFSQFLGFFWPLQLQPACRHSLPTEFKRKYLMSMKSNISQCL